MLGGYGGTEKQTPVFTGSGTGLREEFSGRSRDDGELRCDVLRWMICEFSASSLGRLDVIVYSMYSTRLSSSTVATGGCLFIPAQDCCCTYVVRRDSA